MGPKGYPDDTAGIVSQAAVGGKVALARVGDMIGIHVGENSEWM